MLMSTAKKPPLAYALVELEMSCHDPYRLKAQIAIIMPSRPSDYRSHSPL